MSPRVPARDSTRSPSSETLALSVNNEQGQVSHTVQASLQDADLWAEFDSVGNEMIMTRNGRCLFPTLRFELSGLEPKSQYSVAVDIVQADRDRFKFVRPGKWIPVTAAGTSTHQNDFAQVSSTAAYVNDKGTQSGAYWEKNGASFTKLKITNIPSGSLAEDERSGLFSLQSFHLYQPRVHLIKHRPGHRQVHTFAFPETKFVAVTHYQNVKVNSLKKNYNPHAKGFKDTETKLIASRIRASNPAANYEPIFNKASASSSKSKAAPRTGPRLRYHDHVVPSIRDPSRDKTQNWGAVQHSVDDLFDGCDTSESSLSSSDDDSDAAAYLSKTQFSDHSYDSGQDAIGSPDDSQDSWETQIYVPTALDMLSACCSHILQSGNLSQDPHVLAKDFLSTLTPRHSLDSLVLACELSR
ncbi:T-box transcription factor tbx19 [Geranomyces variabilis]|uniref:T-box transcription factor tbx19 n=1 Tax=Geranomyces variabilis TaxID=109894 RepID=A0AAD5XPZ3_9FUNG|nr:T-box transcription factor tbx19 [Geranomyces variabilis]